MLGRMSLIPLLIMFTLKMQLLEANGAYIGVYLDARYKGGWQ